MNTPPLHKMTPRHDEGIRACTHLTLRLYRLVKSISLIKVAHWHAVSLELTYSARVVCVAFNCQLSVV